MGPWLSAWMVLSQQRITFLSSLETDFNHYRQINVEKLSKMQIHFICSNIDSKEKIFKIHNISTI